MTIFVTQGTLGMTKVKSCVIGSTLDFDYCIQNLKPMSLIMFLRPIQTGKASAYTRMTINKINFLRASAPYFKTGAMSHILRKPVIGGLWIAK